MKFWNLLKKSKTSQDGETVTENYKYRIVPGITIGTYHVEYVLWYVNNKPQWDRFRSLVFNSLDEAEEFIKRQKLFDRKAEEAKAWRESEPIRYR